VVVPTAKPSTDVVSSGCSGSLIGSDIGIGSDAEKGSLVVAGAGRAAISSLAGAEALIADAGATSAMTTGVGTGAGTSEDGRTRAAALRGSGGGAGEPLRTSAGEPLRAGASGRVGVVGAEPLTVAVAAVGVAGDGVTGDSGIVAAGTVGGNGVAGVGEAGVDAIISDAALVNES